VETHNINGECYGAESLSVMSLPFLKNKSNYGLGINVLKMNFNPEQFYLAYQLTDTIQLQAN